MNETPRRATVGVPWFSRDDYEAFRSLLPQRSWHTTYDQWELAANKVLHQQQCAGVPTLKVDVQSAAFALWCRDTGHDINARALVEYASAFARRHLFQDKGP